MILAVDPGKSGAIVVVDDQGKIISQRVMPETLGETHLLIRDIKPIVKIAYVEKSHAMPGQGVVSMFNYGMGFGGLQGILLALEIPFVLITPQSWTKWAHRGCTAKDPKGRSKEAAFRLFPGEWFLPTKQHRVPHEGLIDASLIGLYGLKRETNQLPQAF